MQEIVRTNETLHTKVYSRGNRVLKQIKDNMCSCGFATVSVLYQFITDKGDSARNLVLACKLECMLTR